MKSTHWFCIYSDCILIYFQLVFVVNMEWSISETNRGQKSLLYDGFTYRIDSLLKSGDISWRCTLKTCKARLRTDGESKLLISERPSKLIRSELQTGEEQHLTDNDLKSLSLAIYRQRRKRHPTLPTCIIDVHEALSTMTVKTSKSEDMCLVNDVDSHIITFSCTSNLHVLCTQVKEIFIDRTFKCCPKFFEQLNTIHKLLIN